MKPNRTIASSIWETGFHADLVAACSGSYQGTKPWSFPRTVGEPHGKVDAVAFGLFLLLSDLATEHKAKLAELETQQSQAPEGRKAKHQHALNVHTLDVAVMAISQRCDVVRKLAWAYLASTHESFKTANIEGASVSEKGFLVVPADAAEEDWALAQEHPIRQAGLHIVRIIAGDDRLAEIGLTKDTDTLPVDEIGEGHIAGEAVAFVEDSRLRRLMSLSHEITTRDTGFPCSVHGVVLAKDALIQASGQSSLAAEIFWTLIKDEELADLLEKGYSFAAESDWKITAKRRPRGQLGMIAALGLPMDLGGMEIEVLDLGRPGPHEAADCGNPDCAIHGHRNGHGRPGRRRHTLAPAG